MIQLVECPTLAQVMISQFVDSGPTMGSVLTSQSLEPASDSMSPFLSAPPPSPALSLSLSKINIKKNFFKWDDVNEGSSALLTIWLSEE